MGDRILFLFNISGKNPTKLFFKSRNWLTSLNWAFVFFILSYNFDAKSNVNDFLNNLHVLANEI